MGTSAVPLCNRSSRCLAEVYGSWAGMVKDFIQFEADRAPRGRGDSFCGGKRVGVARHIEGSDRRNGRIVPGSANCFCGRLIVK